MFTILFGPDNCSRVKRAEIGGNLLWKYLGVTFFEHWPAAVKAGLIALQALVNLKSEEVDDLEAYCGSRIVNISAAEITRSVEFAIRSDRFAKYLYEPGQSSRYNAVRMTLDDNKYKALTHAKTCYPNDPTGWSLILALHRVHSVTRELALTN